MGFSLDWTPALCVILLYGLPEMSPPQRSLPSPAPSSGLTLFPSLSQSSPRCLPASAQVRRHLPPSTRQRAGQAAGTHEMSGNQVKPASCFPLGNIWPRSRATSAPAPGRRRHGGSRNEAAVNVIRIAELNSFAGLQEHKGVFHKFPICSLYGEQPRVLSVTPHSEERTRKITPSSFPPSADSQSWQPPCVLRSLNELSFNTASHSA